MLQMCLQTERIRFQSKAFVVGFGLKETAVRLKMQNRLAEIVRDIRYKESELDSLIRGCSNPIEKLEGETGKLTRQKDQLKSDILNRSDGFGISKAT